ncbi:MAG: FHA domain-containing protein, partial [Flavisolibacter sp.]
MFDFLKPKNNPSQPDIKTARHQLLGFIKDQLQRWEGEGSYIKGMQLFIAPGQDQHVYEAVVYYHESGRFQEEEVQKIADDFAIDLPADWTMDIIFSEELPAEAVKNKELPVALHIVTNKKPTINQPTTAKVLVLSGEAEQKEYRVHASSGKICIGRDNHTQTSEGFHRENHIAFPGTSSDPANKYISRQHAHIEWNAEAGCFFLFADEGGLPPRNKVKVKTGKGELIKLQALQIGHPLGENDQIILGELALLQF